MLLKFLLGYIILGIIVVYIRVVIHLIVCAKKHIPINKINHINWKIIKTDIKCVDILIGLIIWPIKLYEFNKNEKNIINNYIINEES